MFDINMIDVYFFRAISKSNCYHKEGHKAPCKYSCNPYMMALGIVEILLSQIPNFHKLSWLSTIAASMSFSYAGIGMGLSFAKIVSGNPFPLTQQLIVFGIVIGDSTLLILKTMEFEQDMEKRPL